MDILLREGSWVFDWASEGRRDGDNVGAVGEGKFVLAEKLELRHGGLKDGGHELLVVFWFILLG